MSEVTTGGKESASNEKLQNLVSKGPLSSSSRVGILLVLHGMRWATFTDLLHALELPKSTLNLCLSGLGESGFVKVRTGFLHKGGPRTIVQITDLGQKAIREYIELMNEILQKKFK